MRDVKSKLHRRVVHLNTVASGGSIPSLIRSLGQGAGDFGFSAEVMFGRGQPPDDLQHNRVGSLHAQAWDLLCSRLLDRAGRHSKTAATALIKLFSDHPPDLVHIHNLHGYWVNQKKILTGLAELGIPVVWTLHDYWPITGHCAYFEKVGCEKWRVRCENCPQIDRYPKSYIDGSTKNFLEKQSIYDELDNLHIVTVSEHSRKLVEESILGRFPATTIYNSIDTSIFRPVAPAMKFDGKIVVGCVAKIWDERKGFDDILKVRDLLDDSYVLLVIGLTRNQMRRLPPGVVGVPQVLVPEDLAALYSSMDVFFNPSSEETFGMTTVEAMACGVPVVLYDVAASREIQPEFMGRGIVERYQHSDTAHIIREIANDVTREMADSLVQYVGKKFSRDAFLNAYYGLYSKMVSLGKIDDRNSALE